MNVIHMKYAKQQVKDCLKDSLNDAKQQVKDMPNPKNDEWMQRTLTYTKLNA